MAINKPSQWVTRNRYTCVAPAAIMFTPTLNFAAFKLNREACQALDAPSDRLYLLVNKLFDFHPF